MLLVAAVILFLTGVAHSYLGERYLLMRLFKRDNLPAILGSTALTAGTLRFAWHLTTVAWWGLGAIVLLVGYGTVSKDTVLLTIGIAALISAVFPIYFTRGKHLSWIAFLLVGALLLTARAG